MPVSPHHSFIRISLNVGLGDVRSVDFDVDLSVILLLLLLLRQRPPVADEVERQQVAQHTESKQSDVDLEKATRIRQCLEVSLAKCLF